MISARFAPRFADSSAMKDEQMAELAPALAREECHEVAFDPRDIGVSGQPESLRQSRNVRVDDDTFVQVVRIAKYDIGRLSCDSAQCQQLVHGARHFAVKIVDQFRRRGMNRLGFVAEQADRIDVRFNLFGRGLRKCFRCGKPFEESRRCLVHPDIGGLGRENRCDKQLERV